MILQHFVVRSNYCRLAHVSRSKIHISAAAMQLGKCLKTIKIDGRDYKFYDMGAMKDPRYDKLPFSIRILLESAVRNCGEFRVKQGDVEKILDWKNLQHKASTEIPYLPAQVVLQDFTGAPAVVDLAALRDSVKKLVSVPTKINPLRPVDLVGDHSVQVDFFGDKSSVEKNHQIEFERNKERFQFLNLGATAFENMQIVPPGSGIVRQVNLEYLARTVFNDKCNPLLYPDGLVGTESHTTMICVLGILGWGIEAEAVMFGQPMSTVLPEVIGYRLIGSLPEQTTGTDLVLTITKKLREVGVTGKFVEFFGPGVATLSITDRATICNMSPEQGSTATFFPIDNMTLAYLKQIGRPQEQISTAEAYFKAAKLFRYYADPSEDAVFSKVIELDLSTIVPCLSGPKRPHDQVPISKVKHEFTKGLTDKIAFKVKRGGGGVAVRAIHTSATQFTDKQFPTDEPGTTRREAGELMARYVTDKQKEHRQAVEKLEESMSSLRKGVETSLFSIAAASNRILSTISALLGTGLVALLGFLGKEMYDRKTATATSSTPADVKK